MFEASEDNCFIALVLCGIIKPILPPITKFISFTGNLELNFTKERFN